MFDFHERTESGLILPMEKLAGKLVLLQVERSIALRISRGSESFFRREGLGCPLGLEFLLV